MNISEVRSARAPRIKIWSIATKTPKDGLGGQATSTSSKVSSAPSSDEKLIFLGALYTP